MTEAGIVPYEEKYRDVVRRCLYETGFGGDGAEIYFEDLELFADINCLYHTDYEPESAFIGMVDGKPAGYLLGCVDTARYMKVMADEIAPMILKNMLLGRYNLGPGVRRYIRRGILMTLRGQIPTAPLAAYPAHLHIDLFKPYRRVGLGSRLILNYIEFLRARGVRGLHLGTSSFHTQSLPFYEKLGFRKYAVRRVNTSFFREISGRDFYNIIYVKNI